MRFTILHRDGPTRGRAGVLHSPHGDIPTPAFMAVGTKATVKGVDVGRLRELGADIVLANAYHLALRPGDAFVEARGGLRKFMGWDGPVLTDSGGFQVFSLAKLARVSDDGVEFRSHLDGSATFFSPERVIEIQRRLGSTICMPLDQPAPVPGSDAEIRAAVERTAAWLDRSVAALRGENLFGIVQGGLSPEWRKRSAAAVTRHDLPGFAIGGLSLGEPADTLAELTRVTCAELPESKPRYLMGVGTPADIARAVAAGVDFFDCVLPTRMGRTGWAFTSRGPVKIKNAKWKDDDSPLDPGCDCPACARHTKAYLRHLFVEDELLGPVLMSMHNLRHYLRLMKSLRGAIEEGRLAEEVARVEASSPTLASRK